MTAKKAESSRPDLPNVLLRHPAFASPPPDGSQGDGVRTSLRSVRNLKDEADILRFALGLFSALAFLEAEGWPRVPSAEDWALNPSGLPVLASGADGDPRQAPAQHAGLLYRLLGGRHFEPGSDPPSLPRRHKHYGLWNAWMADALNPDGGPAPTCRDLLIQLRDLADQSGLVPGLPSTWGTGVVWKPSVRRWPQGFEAFFGRTRTTMEAVFALAGAPDESGRTLAPVYIGDAPPYPFASLEPLVAHALGTDEAARDWMRDRLSEGPEALLATFVALLESTDADGWLLWPASALEPDGLALLRRAASSLKRPIILLDRGQGRPAGTVTRIRLLWLTPTAEKWYLEHAEALFGTDGEAILESLEALPDDQPACGSPLVPPTPASLRKPYRPVLGNPAGDTTYVPPLHEEEAEEDPRRLADEGHLAELAVRARTWQERDGAEGALWSGVVFLLMGQPLVALDLWEGLGGTREARGALGVLRARCCERLHDLGGAKKILASLDEASLATWDRETATMLEGQIRWLEGGIDEAEASLLQLAQRSENPDVRVQALCHAATALLHGNRIEKALRLLQQAEEAAPFHAQPMTRFSLEHRRAMAHRKIGESETALQGFRRARDVMAAYGFRALEAGCECDCGNALRLLYRFDEAAECYRRGEEGAMGLGLSALATDARFNLALCQLEAGDLLRARRVFEKTHEADDPDQNPVYAAIDLLWLATANQALGDYPAALDTAEKGLRLMNRVSDPEVRIPLLALRGDLLLLTGQRRKLTYLCRELKASLKPETDVDDLLAASAIRCAASARGCGDFSGEEQKAALDLLPQASPYFRAYWHLLVGEYATRDTADELERAWRSAREARNPYLSSRVLWCLAERNALPALSPDERETLANYLTRNRIRGPERGLLPLLVEEDQKKKSSPAAPVPDDLALLLAAGESLEESLQPALARVGADAACLVRAGQPPHWWGTCTAAQRRIMLAAAGTSGNLPCSEGAVAGVRGVDGIWCGFFKSGGAFTREQEAFARVWARMLRPDPPGEENPRAAGAVHPAITARLITRSAVMEPVLAGLDRAAAFTFPVLLTGEPGVGKEACAQALHAASPRAGRPWVAANCANLTPTLASSLLFGHKKGAFTGADRDQLGLVEAARDSTLFLDEVGELPPEVQANLLRFLQDGSFLPVGEVRPRVSNARIVAATNRDLEAAVRDGSFREDLYHRLNVIRVRIPPLRRRAEDVPDLLSRFLAQAAEREHLPTPAVDPSVFVRLGGYPWPGNVRELQNLAKALLVASNGTGPIQERHLPERYLSPAQSPPGGATLADILREAERRAIRTAVEESGGNLSQAARSLSVSRQSLLQKMRRLGLRKA